MAGRDSAQLRRTPLRPFHERHGARLVPFAGWEMPVSYPAGTVAEHLHTREAASLFDVAHMGVAELRGAEAAEALERLTPAGVTKLGPGRQRYALLTNDEGGVEDDVMIANTGEALLIILNAARHEHDLSLLRTGLPQAQVIERPDIGLLALQGPQAEAVLAAEDEAAADMRFMDARPLHIAGEAVWTSRSGYTGEDGYELQVPGEAMERVADLLLSDDRVELAGLGARDTLRLEAGLCLYGNDLDERTSPVEAGLEWTIPKRRREEGGYTGEERIARELAEGPSRVRVGLRPQGRKPVRDGAALRAPDGGEAGVVTSGGWSPSLGGPVAMGYVAPRLAEEGTVLHADVRGNDVPCEVVPLPFVPHRYRR